MMLVLLDDGGCPVARSARLWDRILARVRAYRLDRDLAAGVSPEATVALTLRAQTLIGARTRRYVARGAQRVLATAMQAPSPYGPPRSPAERPQVTLCRDRVRDCSAEFGDLIRLLLSDGPVAARGVALATLLLSDGSGPLYRRACADDMRARVREALDALSPVSA